jgi:hydroxyacylglutathione hydrolase
MIQIRQLPLGPIQTNCYLAACDQTGKAAVIDPAWDGAAIVQIAGREGWTISHILLTHSHFDHVGGLAAVKELTGAPLYVHPDARPLLEKSPLLVAQYGYEIDPPPPPDHLLAEGQTITVGQVVFKVMYTPGHAPGHVCFYAAEEGVIFDGDVLFGNGIGRWDLEGGDYDVLMASIEDKLMTLPDETRVLSGHGPATTIGAERPFIRYLQEHGIYG